MQSSTNCIKMSQNTLFSFWNPNDQQYPEVDSLDFGAWFVTDPGEFRGKEYKAGDWLIFFCKNRGQENEHAEWRVSNGIAVFNQTNEPAKLPDPGTYSKVKLDNKGNIVGAGDLTEDDLPASFLKKIDKLAAVLQNKNTEILKNAFQQDTLSPIQADFDEDTGKITLSLKLDEASVFINKYGQLQSNGEGEASFDSEKVETLVESLKEDLEPAAEQTFTATNEQKQEDEDNLLYKINGLSIGDILIKFNKLLSDQEGAIKYLKQQTAIEDSEDGFRIKPAKPNDITKAVFYVDGDSEEMIDIDSGDKVVCYKTCKICTDSRIHKEHDRLRVYIDDEEVESLLCADVNDVTFCSGRKGNFEITEGEAYPEISMFHGYYRAYSFKYSLPELSEGHHVIRFKTENILDTTDTKLSYKVHVNIRKNLIPQIKNVSVSSPVVSKYVSGFEANEAQNLNVSWQVDIGDSKYLPSKISCIDSEEVEYDSLESGILQFSSKLHCDEDSVKEDHFISYAESKSKINLPEFNFDKTDIEEKYRCHIERIPTIGSSLVTLMNFSTKANLLLEGFEKECIIKNNIAMHDERKANNQYVALKFSLPEKTYLNNFYVDIVDKDGKAFQKRRDGTLKDIEIYAALSTNISASYWINGNAPYAGYGNNKSSPLFDGLDLFKSTNIRRYITWGHNPEYITGNLILILSVSNTLDLNRIIKSVKDSIDERIR